MDELYAFIKYKLEEMRKEKKDTVDIDYHKLAQIRHHGLQVLHLGN